MSQEKVSKIVESELEISGISDMSIEEEVKSSKKEFWVSWIFGFGHLVRSEIFHFSGLGIHGLKPIGPGLDTVRKNEEISERTSDQEQIVFFKTRTYFESKSLTSTE